MRLTEVSLVKGSVSDRDHEILNQNINSRIKRILNNDNIEYINNKSVKRVNISIDNIKMCSLSAAQLIVMIQYSYDIVDEQSNQKDAQYIYTPVHYPDYTSAPKGYVDYINTISSGEYNDVSSPVKTNITLENKK